MRAYAKLILPLLCAAACTGAALADELPDLPEHGAEQPPAIAENQPARYGNHRGNAGSIG